MAMVILVWMGGAIGNVGASAASAASATSATSVTSASFSVLFIFWKILGSIDIKWYYTTVRKECKVKCNFTSGERRRFETCANLGSLFERQIIKWKNDVLLTAWKPSLPKQRLQHGN